MEDTTASVVLVTYAKLSRMANVSDEDLANTPGSKTFGLTIFDEV